MAKTGVHFTPCNVGSVEKHNERDPEYLKSVQASGRNLYFFQDLSHKNSSWVNPEYGKKTCAEIFEDLKKIYTDKVGQAPQLNERERINTKTGRVYKVAGWSPIREAAIPIKEDTRIGDFRPVVDWLKLKGWNVIRIDLHKDEGYENQATGGRKMNYHAHLVVDCLDHNTGRTNKLSNEDVSLKGIQRIVAEALGMECGVAKEVTGSEHRDLWQQREYAASKNYKILQTEIKGLSTMIANFESIKSNIIWEIEGLKKQAREGRITQEEMRRTINQLQEELDEVEGKLKEKSESLERATQQLSEITQRKEKVAHEMSEMATRREKAEEDYHALQRAINKDLPKLHEKALHDVSATGWDEAEVIAHNWLEKLGDYVDKLLPSERRVFDKVYQDMFEGSIIEDLAQHGSEIVAVAAALSLGYIEQAMTFADSHGGGGSSPGSGWGRDPNDDDESWRRKCFHMARAMMQPSIRQARNQTARRWHR